MAIECQIHQFNKRLQPRQVRGADGKPLQILNKVVDIQIKTPLGPFVMQAIPVEIVSGIDAGDTVTISFSKIGEVGEVTPE